MLSSHPLHIDRIFSSLWRTLLLIAFGLANVNIGLTSQVVKNHLSDELHRNINQNFVMSPSAISASSTSDGSVMSGPQPGHFAGTSSASASASASPSSPPASSASLSSSSFYASGFSFPLLSSSSSSSSSPSSSSSSSSISSSSSSSSSSLSSLYQHNHQSSGSRITSFDSTNVLTQQQQQSATTYHQKQSFTPQRSFYPSISSSPLHHKVVGVGPSGANGLHENLLIDANTSADGAEGELYAAPMYFGTENSTLVTTQIGATAHIPCTIHHIGDGVVSWIRKKDYHLLTVGLTTYSSDERFSATHLKHSEDWTLQIKFVQLRDAGVYECQVSTHPPTSIFLHLNVVEARAEISGPPIRYLTPGSTLRLQCRVVQNTEASEFIFWYHDNRMINYDIDRGINVSTEPDFQSSELTILRTRREHSGNFTCVASNTQPASVLVHIFKGDNPAAMYHGDVGSSTKSYQTHLTIVMLILSTGYRIFCSRLRIKIV